ncbi:MAG: hypothetical protein KUG77_04695, partial [Nannocystaceae bacterium]|nr:hypothetical protein [Nannocystaceae bacterium]
MLKKIAIALCMLALLAGIAIFVLYRQATALPDWAQREVAEQANLDPNAPVVWEAESENDAVVAPELDSALEAALPSDPPATAPNAGVHSTPSAGK